MFFPIYMKVFQFTASLLIASITLTLVSGACISDRRRHEMTAEERRQAMNLTLEWGRLATFPPSASNLTIKVEGGFFTRTFRSSFRAPRRDLDIWIKESPGLMDAAQTYADGKRKYIINQVAGPTAPKLQSEMMMQSRSTPAGVEYFERRT